jgi:5-dehydro-2-deoxygluconokinase
MPEPAESVDPITSGRIGIDLYPLQIGVPLGRVELFGPFLGGAAASPGSAGRKEAALRAA